MQHAAYLVHLVLASYPGQQLGLGTRLNFIQANYNKKKVLFTWISLGRTEATLYRFLGSIDAFSELLEGSTNARQAAFGDVGVRIIAGLP